MFLDHYNLREYPFHITPNPEFLYLSPSHKEALSTISYGVDTGKGFMALVGEGGLGKTILLQTFLKDRAGAREKIIYLFNSRLSFVGLLLALARELDPKVTGDEPQELLDPIYKALIREYSQGNKVVLLIDEAQNMPEETLEGLRLISNLETPTEKLIHIVLVGRPELRRTLDRFELRQLKQRIAVQATLSPLTREESLDYIQCLLKQAGGRAETIFTRRAMEKIVRQAKGIPLAINILCDKALIAGYGYLQKPVSVKVVNEVIADPAGGKRPFSLRLVPVSLSVFFVIIGVLGLSIYYHPSSLGAKVSVSLSTPDESGPTVTATITRSATEALLPAFRPPPAAEKKDKSPVAQELPDKGKTEASRGKESLSPGDREKEPAATVESLVPETETLKSRGNPDRFPVTKIVREGENFYRLIREIYGASNPVLWEYVRKHNPRIKEDLKIRVGEKLIFPNWNAVARNGDLLMAP
jgi:type II secretory pathway predicted ATPase ExeA